MEYIIILFLVTMWFSAAIFIIPNITPYMDEELKIWEKVVIGGIVIIGAPFILIAQAIELVLDAFLAEGWNNDNNDKFGY